MSAGERFGSWFLAITWLQDGLTKSAEIGVTNPDVVSDADADRAVITVRASASSERRFVVERLYERRRAVSRVDSDQLESWLTSAIERAIGYNAASLRDAYATGVDDNEN